MKWFKLFWFRLKVLFTARHICSKHLCEKRWKEIKRLNRWMDVRRCPECEAETVLKRQRKADSKHFKKDDLELQCMKWRKVLGYKTPEPVQIEQTTAMPEPVAEGATPEYANLGVAPAGWTAQNPLLGGTGQANAYRTYVVGANAINTTTAQL